MGTRSYNRDMKTGTVGLAVSPFRSGGGHLQSPQKPGHFSFPIGPGFCVPVSGITPADRPGDTSMEALREIMPWKPKRPCRFPGCPGLSSTGNVCDKHLEAAKAERQAYDHGRGTPSQRGYGAAWRKVRAVVLARDGYTCTAVGCGAPAAEVDHRLARHLGGSEDESNLTSLCRAHHRSKSGIEAQRVRFPR
jgi:5-methylcytosine-specific restriction enzyme A